MTMQLVNEIISQTYCEKLPDIWIPEPKRYVADMQSLWLIYREQLFLHQFVHSETLLRYRIQTSNRGYMITGNAFIISEFLTVLGLLETKIAKLS